MAEWVKAHAHTLPNKRVRNGRKEKKENTNKQRTIKPRNPTTKKMTLMKRRFAPDTSGGVSGLTEREREREVVSNHSQSILNILLLG